MAGRFDGSVVFITGGASGIGQAAALAFARDGARVVIGDRDRNRGPEVVETICRSGGQAEFHYVDVSIAGEVESVVAAIDARYQRLDFALNNAGIVGPGTLVHEHLEEEWDRVIAVNLKGIWLCMKSEIPLMLRYGKGAIVNTASVLGLAAAEKSAAYTASKHGVIGLTRAAALDYARYNLRINAVCPGAIRTPMIESIIENDPYKETLMASFEPLKRLGTAEEVAEALIWLCSDSATFIHGHALAVDGGYLIK